MSGGRDELEDLARAADQAGLQAVEISPGAPGGSVPGSETGAPPATSPNLGVIVFMLSTFRTIGGAVLQAQSLAVTLTDPNIEACAAALAPVADKYGLDLAGAFGRLEIECTAIMVAGPILWEAARQLHLELKAKKAKPVAAAADGDDQAGKVGAAT